MSDQMRMTLLHHSTNDLIEELLMWKSLAAEKLDRIAELEAAQRWTKGGDGSHWEGCEDVHWDCKIVQLEAELAARDALIERLVDCGDALADLYDSEMYPETAIESRDWRALVAEWKASEDGGSK